MYVILWHNCILFIVVWWVGLNWIELPANTIQTIHEFIQMIQQMNINVMMMATTKTPTWWMKRNDFYCHFAIVRWWSLTFGMRKNNKSSPATIDNRKQAKSFHIKLHQALQKRWKIVASFDSMCVVDSDPIFRLKPDV